MADFGYQTTGSIGARATLGLIVLQADETIEQDFRRLIPEPDIALYVSRVPSGLEVTGDTLAAMAETLPNAARLFPASVTFDVVGYGCTSGTSVIGTDRVAELIKGGCRTAHVTEPVSALVAACRARRIARLAFLSPYIESVSRTLRETLQAHGIETPVFGSFGEAREEMVARIAPTSILEAATALAAGGGVDGIFLSCTNLRTLYVIDQIETATGLPVLSSNLVLAEHMRKLAGL